jgi:hypothetical protein
MLEALQPTQDPGWVPSYGGYNVLDESAVGLRLALGRLGVVARYRGGGRP